MAEERNWPENFGAGLSHRFQHYLTKGLWDSSKSEFIYGNVKQGLSWISMAENHNSWQLLVEVFNVELQRYL
jgi:hypothetical protein